VIVSAEIVALIAAAVAVFAAVLAVRATALVARTVLANASQAGPPRQSIRIVEGQARRDLATDTREYSFVVVVANESSGVRRFEPPTLRVTYRTRANFLGAVDIASSELLTVPAGRSETVTLRFSTSNVIPRHCRVDQHTLLLVDDQGARVSLDASLPAVVQADTDGDGSRTWGYD
jgi:hypothetical protein